MRSIKEQREMTIHIEHAELLDWAERARKFIYEMRDQLGCCEKYCNCDYCSKNYSCDCPWCTADKLLKELPEE